MPQHRIPNLELTSTQKNSLRVYLEYQKKHGAPPSVRQLAEALECSHHSAHCQIKMLEQKGYLAPVKVTTTRLEVSPKGVKALGLA